MKELVLSRGKVALVDDEDYESLSKFKWCVCEKRKGVFYAVARVNGWKKPLVYLHRFLLNPSEKLQVDHINGNPLDNRRINLRIVNNQQNNFNSRKPKTNSTGFKGVWFDKNLSKFRAGLSHNNKTIHLGCFTLKEDAAKAYNQFASKLRGEYANLNTVYVA